MSSSFALWWRRALPSHCPPPLRYETCPLFLGEPGSTFLICYRPSPAHFFISMQLFLPTLQPWYRGFGRLWYLSHPWSAGLSNERSCILPEVLFPSFPTLMCQLKAQRQTKSPENWMYETSSSLRKVSLLLYFIPAVHEKFVFCSTTPSAIIPWGILLIIFQSDSLPQVFKIRMYQGWWLVHCFQVMKKGFQKTFIIPSK